MEFQFSIKVIKGRFLKRNMKSPEHKQSSLLFWISRKQLWAERFALTMYSLIDESNCATSRGVWKSLKSSLITGLLLLFQKTGCPILTKQRRTSVLSIKNYPMHLLKGCIAGLYRHGVLVFLKRLLSYEHFYIFCTSSKFSYMYMYF